MFNQFFKNTMKVGVTLLTCMSFTFTLPGCATMFSGTTDRIFIKSDVPETEIYINDLKIANNEVFASIPKKGDHTILVRKAGCTDQSVLMEKRFDPMTLLGAFVDFGIISILLVDFIAVGSIQKAAQTEYILNPKCP